MKRNNRKTGAAWERVAGAYLEEQGYQILEYNFRCRTGEIDIIARDGEYLVFCEVKYRQNHKAGSPLEAVTPAKQRKISEVALYYTCTRNLTEIPCRFDVAGISEGKIELVKNAFDYTG